jgi:hypothetical protein
VGHFCVFPNSAVNRRFVTTQGDAGQHPWGLVSDEQMLVGPPETMYCHHASDFGYLLKQ